MGECAYYFKAEFPTKKEALAASKKLNKFFLQARHAYDYWQNPLALLKDQRFPIAQLDNKLFWNTFQERYPLVTEYVKHEQLFGRDPGVLSRKLDFGQTSDNETILIGDTVGWCDSSVGHMSDWSPLCAFVKEVYGAVRAVYGNEEDGCASLESLNLYEWEDIVKAILKQKKVLPLLLHVNNDLDELIERTMRNNK
jgi:hypothetical protein